MKNRFKPALVFRLYVPLTMLIGLMDDMFIAGIKPQMPPMTAINRMYIKTLPALVGISMVCPSIRRPMYGAIATAIPTAIMAHTAVKEMDSNIYLAAMWTLSAPTRLLVAISLALLFVKARLRLT